MGVGKTAVTFDGTALIAELGSFNRHLRAANEAPLTIKTYSRAAETYQNP